MTAPMDTTRPRDQPAREVAARSARALVSRLLSHYIDESARGLPLSALLPIVYPNVDDQAALCAAAQGALHGRDRVRTLAELRLLLGSVDRQSFPSPVRVRLPADEIVWHEEDGLHFALDPQDSSVSAFVANSDYEPHVKAILRAVCEPAWSVIDVGANLGYHTVHLANLVGPLGSVLAVEANPDNCLLINAAVESNHFTNVHVVPCALGSERGWSYFTTHVGTNGGLLVGERSAKPVIGAGTVVPVLRMDDLVGVNMPLNLIKVDVEGAEGLVMQGGPDSLARHRPVVISEFSFEMLRRVSGWEPRQYLDLFRQLGYRLNVIDKESPGNLVSQDYDQLLKSWPDEFHIEDLLLMPG